MATAVVSIGSVPISKYRRGARGPKVSMKPDLLVRAEFEPDNSRIGCESYGLQASVVSILNPKWTLTDHYMAEIGIVPSLPVISYTAMVQPVAPKSKPAKSPYFSVWNTRVPLKSVATGCKRGKYSWSPAVIL